MRRSFTYHLCKNPTICEPDNPERTRDGPGLSVFIIQFSAFIGVPAFFRIVSHEEQDPSSHQGGNLPPHAMMAVWYLDE